MNTLYCPAKVNLYLAILGRDLSGYHLIDTIYVRYEGLQDKMEIEAAPKSHIEFLPAEGINPNDNTVLRTPHILEEKFKKPFNYHIRILKKIPLRSGLGGASSNAASLLLYLNEVEKLGLSRAELMDLGAQIGMDLPFFLSGYLVARGSHYGEVIDPLPPLPRNLQLEVGFTGIAMSTKESYEEWDRRKLISTAPQWESIGTLHNDFEQIFPDLSFKNSNTVLSGSGGAYARLLGLLS